MSGLISRPRRDLARAVTMVQSTTTFDSAARYQRAVAHNTAVESQKAYLSAVVTRLAIDHVKSATESASPRRRPMTKAGSEKTVARRLGLSHSTVKHRVWNSTPRVAFL